MSNFKFRRAGGGLLTILLLLLLVGTAKRLIDPPPASADDECESVEYLSMAPEVTPGSVAFGPSIETRIENFSSLKGQELVDAVKEDEKLMSAQYASQTYTQAIHRGILPWTSSDQEWIDQLVVLDADPTARCELFGKIQDWNTKASAEVIYLDQSYNSDWLVRSDYGPFLRQGPGHDDAAGWVIRWTHEDGTVVIERLTCMYQWVGEIPPSVPPVTTPPCEACTPPPTTPCSGKTCETPPPSPTIPPAPGGSPTTQTTVGPSATAPPDPTPTGSIVTVDPPVSTSPSNYGGPTPGVTIPSSTAPLPTSPPATAPIGGGGSD